MKDFFSDMLDRAERMLLDMPPPYKNTYVRPPYQPVTAAPPKATEQQDEDGEGVSMQGKDAVSMEGPEAAVTWNNAGTYQPLIREAGKVVVIEKKNESSSTASVSKPLSFSKDAIANGIIMAEILGKPLALRGRR